LWIPRSTVQGILDSSTTSQPALKSALNSVLQSSGQFILKSTIQSILNSTKLTTQPAPKSTPESTIVLPDTRPIWPGRPELIYQQYLAEKEAWLADNLEVQPASYRKARGLEIYSLSWFRRRRLELPKQRLDLVTETLLKGTPDWTYEVVSAWLDWDKIQEEEVDKQVEA
jgi:hypothetical protein